MILEELCKIKSFGSDMESSVTPEDIADKERELGFVLPQALKELYLTFHPDDPAFYSNERIQRHIGNTVTKMFPDSGCLWMNYTILRDSKSRIKFFVYL